MFSTALSTSVLTTKAVLPDVELVVLCPNTILYSETEFETLCPVAFNLARLLVIVWNDAPDKVGLGGMQCVHQRVQLLGVEGGHCLGPASLLLFTLAGFLLLPALAGMVLEGSPDEAVGPRLEELNDSVVERILVLLQPAGHIVGHSSSIVNCNQVKTKSNNPIIFKMST